MHLLRAVRDGAAEWWLPELRRRPAAAPQTSQKAGLTFGYFAAERAIFLFKGGNVTGDEQLGLFNPIVAANPASKSA